MIVLCGVDFACCIRKPAGEVSKNCSPRADAGTVSVRSPKQPRERIRNYQKVGRRRLHLERGKLVCVVGRDPGGSPTASETSINYPRVWLHTSSGRSVDLAPHLVPIHQWTWQLDTIWSVWMGMLAEYRGVWWRMCVQGRSCSRAEAHPRGVCPVRGGAAWHAVDSGIWGLAKMRANRWCWHALWLLHCRQDFPTQNFEHGSWCCRGGSLVLWAVGRWRQWAR